MSNIYELLTRPQSFARDEAWPRPWTLWPRDRWRGSALRPWDQTPLGWRSRAAWPGCTRCSSGCPWRWCPSCLLSHNPEIMYLNYLHPDHRHVQPWCCWGWGDSAPRPPLWWRRSQPWTRVAASHRSNKLSIVRIIVEVKQNQPFRRNYPKWQIHHTRLMKSRGATNETSWFKEILIVSSSVF